MTEIEYHPAGLMCAFCRHIKEDCSTLDFKSMRPIDKYDNVIVVKCTKFERISDGRTKD